MGLHNKKGLPHNAVALFKPKKRKNPESLGRQIKGDAPFR